MELLCEPNLLCPFEPVVYATDGSKTGGVVEWLERSAVVRQVVGSSLALVNNWKAPTVHPEVNGYMYLIYFMVG